jgi:hypothetical protein
MKRKILIVGLGGMGEAHLNSILKLKNYEIQIYERNLKKLNSLKNKYNLHNIKFLNNLPKHKKYYLCIISTNPKERFVITKTLLRENKLSYILLEKFVFSRTGDYKKILKYLKKKKVKAYVNTWADFIIHFLKLKLKDEKVSMNIFINSGRMLTNLIHFLSLFSLLKNDFNLKLENKKNVKFFLSKNTSYHEMSGEVLFKSSDDSKLNIQSKILKNKIFIIVIKSINNHLKISLTQNLKIKMLNLISSKKKSTNFPLVSEVTGKNIKNFNKSLFLDYKLIEKNSILILNLIKKSSKNQIFVR